MHELYHIFIKYMRSRIIYYDIVRKCISQKI